MDSVRFPEYRKELMCIYRPTSKAGDAMGENSEVIMNMPSNFLSGYGAVTSHETRTTTLDPVSCVRRGPTACPYLVLPIFTSTRPYSSPKVSSTPLYSSEDRPSRRTFCRSALRINSRSLLDSSASRGMILNCDCCYATMVLNRQSRCYFENLYSTF